MILIWGGVVGKKKYIIVYLQDCELLYSILMAPLHVSNFIPPELPTTSRRSHATYK